LANHKIIIALLVVFTSAIVDAQVPRPSYNSGNGFYVANGKLYDANGVEFRIRGVNRCHYDSYIPAISKTHSNAMRWLVYFDHTDQILGYIQRDNLAQKVIPIPGNWAGTCQNDASYVTSMVDTWVAQVAKWNTIERYLILNIANEWGPSNSTVWRDTYITAIKRLRAAGYTCTLQVTSGGCGQDNEDIHRYGKEVFESDPEKNVIFDQHIYGGWGDQHPWQIDLKKGLDNLASTGLPIVCGEFGPGRDIGPSPTNLTPLQIMQGCEEHGFGWLAWAWDDRPYNCPDEQACENTFALSWDGVYNSTHDLTNFGRVVVEDPTYGLLKLAKPATIF